MTSLKIYHINILKEVYFIRLDINSNVKFFTRGVKILASAAAQGAKNLESKAVNPIASIHSPIPNSENIPINSNLPLTQDKSSTKDQTNLNTADQLLSATSLKNVSSSADKVKDLPPGKHTPFNWYNNHNSNYGETQKNTTQTTFNQPLQNPSTMQQTSSTFSQQKTSPNVEKVINKETANNISDAKPQKVSMKQQMKQYEKDDIYGKCLKEGLIKTDSLGKMSLTTEGHLLNASMNSKIKLRENTQDDIKYELQALQQKNVGIPDDAKNNIVAGTLPIHPDTKLPTEEQTHIVGGTVNPTDNSVEICLAFTSDKGSHISAPNNLSYSTKIADTKLAHKESDANIKKGNQYVRPIYPPKKVNEEAKRILNNKNEIDYILYYLKELKLTYYCAKLYYLDTNFSSFQGEFTYITGMCRYKLNHFS